MNINRVLLKSDARAAIRESKTSPYLTALIYAIIVYILGLLQSKLTGVTVDYSTFYNALESGNYNYLYNTMQQQTPDALSSFIGTLIQIMAMIINVGFIMNTLLVARRLPNSFGNLFDGFASFFRYLWLYVLIFIFTFLWSLLFIIPGIIAAYRYRQAVYLLIDNPNMGALEAIRRSKQLMNGHKAELFVLDLSFIGWYLLTIIPFVSVFVYPYTYVTYAGYYNALLRANENLGQNPPYGANRSETGLPPWERKK